MKKKYYAISSIVLYQCAIESYINHLIHDKDVSSSLVQDKNRTYRLIDGSIKDKYYHFPQIMGGRTFYREGKIFTNLSRLVKLRNALVHFETVDHDYIIDDKTSELVGVNNYEGNIDNEIVPCAIEGQSIVSNLIFELHELLGTEPPAFLNEEWAYAIKVIKA